MQIRCAGEYGDTVLGTRQIYWITGYGSHRSFCKDLSMDFRDLLYCHFGLNGPGLVDLSGMIRKGGIN